VGATKDAARRRFAAAAPPQSAEQSTAWRPGAREPGVARL